MAEVYVDETPAALTEAAALLTGGAPEEPPFKRSKSAEEIAPLGSVAPSLATPGLTAPGLAGIAPLPTPGLAGIAPLSTPGLVGIAPLQTAETAGFASFQTAETGGFAPYQTAETAGIAPFQTAGQSGIAPLPAAGPGPTGVTPASTMPAGQPRNTDESQNPFDILRQSGINISLNFNFGNMPPRA